MNNHSTTNTRSTLTIIGCIIIIAVSVCYQPSKLLFSTYSSSSPALKDLINNPTHEVARTARTNIVNVYRSRIHFDIGFYYEDSDQQCRAVNMYWFGVNKHNGKYFCQPALDMYFSTKIDNTDTIIPGNRLVMILANGDSIVKPSNQTFAPFVVDGGFQGFHSFHTERKSYYAPFSGAETKLLRSENIIEIRVESKHDLLSKKVSPESGERLKQRFIFLTDTFSK